MNNLSARKKDLLELHCWLFSLKLTGLELSESFSAKKVRSGTECKLLVHARDDCIDFVSFFTFNSGSEARIQFPATSNDYSTPPANSKAASNHSLSDRKYCLSDGWNIESSSSGIRRRHHHQLPLWERICRTLTWI
jgi:hypothetical protein